MRRTTVVACGAALMIGTAPIALAQTTPTPDAEPGQTQDAPESPGADLPDTPDPEVDPDTDLEAIPDDSGDETVQEMDREQMRSMLRAQGMEDVDELERDGDHFVTTVEWFGETVELRLNAQTGEIVEPKYLTERQVENQLKEVQGFDEVTELEQDGDFYTARAKRGNFDYVLTVDARTGAVVDQKAS